MNKNPEQQEELELSAEQCARNDEIDNAVFELCKVLTENPDLEWSMEFIGEIADAAAGILTRKGMRVRFPAIVTLEDDSQYIEEYYDCEGPLANLPQK